MKGVVNLQNLQEARLAINYLRRDFASSCPLFIYNGKSYDYKMLQEVRKQLFATENNDGSSLQEYGILIGVDSEGIRFFKFKYDTQQNEIPKVELVRYVFNSTTKCLVREVGIQGKERYNKKEFKGFEEVRFALYANEIASSVPLLWVKFKIHESSNIYGSENFGKALELTTTLSSNFINSSQNNTYWRYETLQNLDN